MSEPASAPQLVAVYGTLLRGQEAHGWFELSRKARFIGACVIEGDLLDLGEYPGLVPGDGKVMAELFELTAPDILDELDAYEDINPDSPDQSPFARRLTALQQPAGTSAWVYVYQGDRDGMVAIPSGDWRVHVAART